MSKGLELCATVAGLNKIAQHLKGIKFFEDGTAMASNLSNTIKVEGTPIKFDCLLDPTDLVKIWKAPGEPEITAGGHDPSTNRNTYLTIKKGRFKADLMYLDQDGFDLDPNKTTEGTEIDPEGVIEAIRRIHPFLKVTKNQIWILDDWFYVTNGSFVVRTPADCKFSTYKSGDKPMTITQECAELLLSIKEKATKLTINNDRMTFWFETLWLETTRFSPASVGRIDEVFKNYEQFVFTDLPAEVVQSLGIMADMSDKNDVINFAPLGATLLKSGKSSWSIAHNFPNVMLFSADALKSILGYKEPLEFDFTDPWKLLFRTKREQGRLEGVWAAMKSTQPAKQYQENGESEDSQEYSEGDEEGDDFSYEGEESQELETADVN